jgi:hypothetical protein
MNDLIPIAIFTGCLLATFGLVRVCEWLKPTTSVHRSEADGGNAARTAAHSHAEATR